MKVLLILLFAALAASAQEDDEERIIDGADAPLGKYPFYAFLRRLGENRGTQCGASIISDRWVLSAAHCTAKSPAEDLWVMAGFLDNTLLSFLQRSQGLRKFEHPGYNAQRAHDLVMIQLKTQFYFDSTIQGISLPDGNNDNIPDFQKCDVVGFGHTHKKGEPEPDVNPQYQVLQWAEVLTVPLATCQQFYGSFVNRFHTCFSRKIFRNTFQLG